MRSENHLWEGFISFENIFRAWKDASKGRRRRPDVAAFEENLEINLHNIIQRLNQNEWTPGKYSSFYVEENGVRRLISAAPFPDRIVHHALVNVLEPIWERRFLGASHANRKGMGGHKAMARADWGLQNCAYCLKCDIRKYFPSIDHEILYSLIARHVADKRILNLVHLIIDSGRGVLNSECPPMIFPGDDDLTALMRPRGLPIGNQTSQFFANVMLHPLDVMIAQEIRPKTFVRYVDDFLLFDDDREKLNSLRLKLHPRKVRLFPCTEGVNFVGYRLTRQQIRLPRASVSRIRARLKHNAEMYSRGELTLEQVRSSVTGMAGHIGKSQGVRLFGKLLDEYLVLLPPAA